MSRMPRFHKVFTINYTINATDLPEEEPDVPQAADYRAPKINNLVEPLKVQPKQTEQSAQPESRVGLFYSVKSYSPIILLSCSPIVLLSYSPIVI